MNADDTVVVSVENAAVRFGAFTALDKVLAKAPKGKITGLIGPAGAGKTTLV